MEMSVSRRPFRARRVAGRRLGFRRSGSILGYSPAAASRLPRPDGHGSVRLLPRLPRPDGHGSVRFSLVGPAPLRVPLCQGRATARFEEMLWNSRFFWPKF